MRIDAPREEGLELLVDAGTAERFLDQRVEAEAGEVAFVKDDRMTKRNGWDPLESTCRHASLSIL